MAQTELSNVIQVAAVLTAVGASIVALLISAKDRANARGIAEMDRTAAIRHAKLMFELDAASRLLENQIRGGSKDPDEAERMGQEALALIAILGRERVPRLWDGRINRDDEALIRDIEEESTFEQWADALSAHLAVNAIVRDIDAERQRKGPHAASGD
ncbi:hypothetical protein C5C71_06465 [Rathayibacter sp. AY1C1]|uniref:hypothetical protein n=1 Tax=Rathayibacter sp. AY1C1 TaxID=2080534 RepID=UPI000CE8575B|nr:hypothetical protein [Rathayibacter sp. AY1C1]PPH11643.1 hypothetical protein C5C71_06465 [Rathayibacter sp. AY1C1]